MKSVRNAINKYWMQTPAPIIPKLAISFWTLRKKKKKKKVKSLSRVRLFATPWTTAYQAPPSMGFSRQEYWSGVPLPSLMHVIVSENKFRECVKIYVHV